MVNDQREQLTPEEEAAWIADRVEMDAALQTDLRQWDTLAAALPCWGNRGPSLWVDMWEQVWWSRDALTDALRRALLDILEHNANKLGTALDALRSWAGDANIEALSEWLGKGGWDKVDGDAVEAALVKAAGPKGIPDGARSTTLSKKYHCNCLLMYEVPRGDLDKPAARERIKKDPLRRRITPAPRVLLGLNALKAGLQGFDWKGLVFLLTDKAKESGDWLRQLAGPWLEECAEKETARLDRQENARTLDSAPRVIAEGREYSRLPKVAAGMSWAFGGPGVHMNAVEVDGKIYCPAPDLAISPRSMIVPASYSLLPADYAARPHQALLAIDVTGDEYAPPLAVALMDATQYAISPAAGKLGLFIMGAAWANKGKLYKTTLRELTAAMNSKAPEIRNTHYQTISGALQEIDGLRMVLPNGLSYRAFECPVTWRELTPNEYDTTLYVGLTKAFDATLADIANHAGKAYRGDFLFDGPGCWELPTNRAGLLRQYIRACALWNSQWKPGTKGEPAPDRIREISTERWAGMTNCLTPAAVEYLKGKGKGDRRRLSDSLKRTLKDAADLEGMGLVKLVRADRKAIRILPPDSYIEAWRQSRKGAAKMNPKG